jgi:predicted phosphodiesterase
MKSSVFRYIHLSDFHLCIEPRRGNVLPLLKLRNLVEPDVWSSVGKQVKRLGPKSILYPASYEPEVLSGAARFCRQKHETVDAIIVSGDLCTTGMLDDLIVAEKFLNGSKSTNTGFTASIDFCRDKVVTVPGNHDRYKDNFADPNCINFELKFGRFLRNFSDRVGHWVDAIDQLKIAFVFIDFTLKSKKDAKPQNRYGRGRAYPEIVEEAISRSDLLIHKYPNAHLVWVLHFAPYDCGDFLMLEGSDAMLSAATKCNVKAILNGHTHKPLFDYHDGIPIACAGSTCAFDSTGSHAIHILEFRAYENGNFTVSREDFGWDARNQEFHATSGRNATLTSWPSQKVG